jgi:hypothetical protein
MGPREALRAFAKKTLSIDAVMRVLVEHDGWHVPMHLLARNVVEQVVMYASELERPVEIALVFTDREGADAFAEKFGGKNLGVYVANVSGVELFEQLASDRPETKSIKELRVNPGGPKDETWFMGATTFAISAQLSQAVALERAIARAQETKSAAGLTQTLIDFPHWVLAAGKSDRSFMRVPIPGKGEHVVLFTALDRKDVLLDAVQPEMRAQIGFVTLSGRELFPLLARTPYAGAIVNPNSTPQLVMPKEMLTLLAT